MTEAPNPQVTKAQHLSMCMTTFSKYLDFRGPSNDPRPKVIGFPFQFGHHRYGHMIFEPYLHKACYDPKDHQLVLVVPDIDDYIRDSHIFELASQDVEIFTHNDFWRLGVAYVMAKYNTGPLEIRIDDATLVARSFYNMSHQLYENARAGIRRAPYTATLSARAEEMVAQLADRVGLDLKAPFVVLHVREAGWKGDNIGEQIREEAYHTHRNGSIEDFAPAVRMLRDRGYQVVRIGDASMRRLPDFGDGVFDLADAAVMGERDRFGHGCEAQLVAKCRFMIGNTSGPVLLTALFDTPALVFECTPLSVVQCLGRSWLVFRMCRREATGETLSLREILEGDIPEYFTAKDFADAGLTLPPHDPEMIRAAVADMADWVEGAMSDADLEAANAPWRAVVEEGNDRRLARGVTEYRRKATLNPDMAKATTPLLFAHPFTRVPPSFLEFHARDWRLSDG